MTNTLAEIETRVLLPLRVAGVDVSITNEVVLVWMAAVVTLLVLLPACRRRELVPRGWYHNLMEGLIELIEREVIQENLGPAGRAWAPFLLTLFFFVLFCNLIGLIPVPAVFKPVTSNINVTAALAVLVFLLTIAASIRTRGLRGFLAGFLPADLPWWAAVLMLPIEVMSWLARPLSLALRLFANMMAGHALIFVFIGLAMGSAWLLAPVPLVGAILMDTFELFVCFIQAFIFALLSGLYIKEAVQEEHG